jgi:AcrR family transcriptional regulator
MSVVAWCGSTLPSARRSQRSRDQNTIFKNGVLLEITLGAVGDARQQLVYRMLANVPSVQPAVLTDEARRLVDAYLDMLADADTLDVRVADVVSAAGSCNAAFYRSFESKDELLLAASLEAARRSIDAMWHHLSSDPTPEAIIEAWVHALLSRASTRRAVAATRAFALDRHRLMRAFPHRASANVELLQAPLDLAMSDAPPTERRMRSEAIFEMIMSLQARYIASGRPLSKKKISEITALCLELARIHVGV